MTYKPVKPLRCKAFRVSHLASFFDLHFDYLADTNTRYLDAT